MRAGVCEEGVTEKKSNFDKREGNRGARREGRRGLRKGDSTSKNGKTAFLDHENKGPRKRLKKNDKEPSPLILSEGEGLGTRKQQTGPKG